MHRLALLLQPRNNGPGQVRLSGARQAREQQGVARQAVVHGVVHPVPPPLLEALRLHARRPAAQQRLRLLHAVDRRAVRVAHILDAPPRYLEVKTDCLLTQRLPKRFAERLRALEAGPWPPCSAQSPAPRRGWGGRCVDEVPHHAPLVGKSLGEVRARAVQLAAAAAHAVDHLRAARPQAYHRVYAELDAGGHAALQAGRLRAVSQRLLAVAVAAQRLQSLHAAREGLPHRHHVVQLAGACRQPAAAQRASKSSASPPRRAPPISP